MVALFAQQSNTSLPIDEVLHGDCLEVLRSLPDNSVDAIICDPPAAVSFMGKSWDSDKGGRTQWVAWLSEIMQETLRCLKPGGYGLIWALPRTSHWTALALEDAGFIVKDCVSHIFGSGFPKSMDISKAIDKMQGAEREVIGTRMLSDITSGNYNKPGDMPNNKLVEYTAPATPEAQQWAGYGTALKPSTEFWWLVQKPISEKTIAANVLKWGTGGLNIAATRIGTSDKLVRPAIQRTKEEAIFPLGAGTQVEPPGRFPSHLLLSHSVWCVPRGVKRVRANGPACTTGSESTKNAYGEYVQRSQVTHRDPDGMEEVEDFECVEDCPVRLLDEQSGIRKSGGGIKSKAGHSIGMLRGEEAYHFKHDGAYCEPSEGGASRYFTCFSPDNEMVDNYVTSLYNSGNNEEVNQWQSQTHGATTENQTADGIENGESQEAVKSTNNLSIDGCGNRQTALYQRDTKSTTSTSMQPTTDLKTSSLSLRNGTTTTTTDSEKTIVSTSRELRNDGASMERTDKDTGNLWTISTSDEQEPITDTANNVVLKSSLNGATLTEDITENMPTLGMQNNEQKRDTSEAPTRTHLNNRYFQTFHYFSKASRRERNQGCEGLPAKPVTDADKWAANDRRSGTPRNPTEWKPEPQGNNHPTVKSQQLMSWLCRLIIPPDGIVLDPFLGSGSTAVAAIHEGFHFIGIEAEAEYVAICEARIAHALKEVH